MVAQFFGLKKACIHPTTLRPYIVSISGGKDISTENLQVFNTDESVGIIDNLTSPTRTASPTLSSCSFIPSKIVTTTLMMIPFTRLSRRRQARHWRRQLLSTIRMEYLRVCDNMNSRSTITLRYGGKDGDQPTDIVISWRVSKALETEEERDTFMIKVHDKISKPPNSSAVQPSYFTIQIYRCCQTVSDGEAHITNQCHLRIIPRNTSSFFLPSQSSLSSFHTSSFPCLLHGHGTYTTQVNKHRGHQTPC